MTELWYEAELKRPPLVTVEVPDARFVERLHQSIEQCMHSKIKEAEEFDHTAALLSRLIARRKSSFRRMIGFRNLLKLNAATCRLLRVDLPRDLETFCGALPDMVCGENAIASLPTRNCLDYVLVRLLSVHHIQLRINELCVKAGTYFVELLRANNFFDISTLLVTVIGKILTSNAQLGNKYNELYDNLLKNRNKFPLVKRKSLITESTELPGKLKSFELPMFELDEDTSEVSNTTKQSSLASAVITNTLKVPKIKRRIDVGTELVRSQDSSHKSQQKFSVDQLKTVEDVKRFIAAENKSRKKSSSTHNCIAHRIPSHLWAGAQKIFERKLKAGEHKKAMSVFLKFLSSNL